MSLRRIQDAEGELKGTRVICRVDFNVPIKDSGIVLSDFRIKAALPTIEFLQKAGAKVILISHIGRNPEESLQPVANYMIQNLGMKIDFIPGLFGADIEDKIDSMNDGDIVMLENLRRDSGEVENNSLFVKELSEYGEIYVNEAFSVSHRNHASITGLAVELPSFAGLRLQEEVERLSLENREHPILAVIGGKKFETKSPLIERFIEDADQVYVCGALAHDIYTARGLEIGVSLHGKSASKEIIESDKIFAPTDVLVENGARDKYKKVEEVLNNDNIVDIGMDSLDELKSLSKQAKTVIWNGPLGRRNIGTENYLEFLQGHPGEVIIGGGDTVSLIEKMGLMNEFSFVSTGGGSMLKYMEKGSLVGIDVLLDQ
ncbi:MAG: phosphoglycerate kinase [Candidatus Paceibacteria bacterium]|jgi:phosphoglycerate kinase